MASDKVFINRRKGSKRRVEDDPCENLPVDLYHRKRRKHSERRDQRKTLADDYYAYVEQERPEHPN